MSRPVVSTAPQPKWFVFFDQKIEILIRFAFQVIKCLKNLSINYKICVITSIHQPNSELLMLFDKLYVLSKGGHNIYSGRPLALPQYLYDFEIQFTGKVFAIEA